MKPFIFIVTLIALVYAASARAQDAVADFYRGKQVQLRIGSAPGSGYDIVGRLVAAHLGKYIPGAPTVIVQNVPGAGSLTLANQLANTAARDGTIVGVVSNGMPTAPLLTPDTARFDITKLGWIGSSAPETIMVMVWHESKAQTMQDLFTQEVVVGAAQLGTATMDNPLVANAALGTKFKIIPGYNGTTDIDLAMERGEIDGHAGIGWVTAKARNQQWFREGKVRILAQYGFTKHPELENVPLLPMPDDPVKRAMMDIIIARQEFGRPLVAPPDVPRDRLNALRHAYDAAMKDPDLLREAAQATMDIHPLTGEQLEALAAKVLTAQPEAVARVKDILDPAKAGN